MNARHGQQIGQLSDFACDVTDTDSIVGVLPGLDVMISSFGAGNAAKNPADAVARAIADPGIYARAAASLLTALHSRPRVRLIVIGGAATLEVEPGLVFADSDELLNAAIDGFGLPREYAAAMRGQWLPCQKKCPQWRHW